MKKSSVDIHMTLDFSDFRNSRWSKVSLIQEIWKKIIEKSCLEFKHMIEYEMIKIPFIICKFKL